MSWLVEFSSDWSDEFDVHGFTVLTNEDKRRWDDIITNKDDLEITWYFGTNEGWEGEEVGEWASKYDFTQISEDEAKMLIKRFGPTYGNFPDLIELANDAEEAESDTSMWGGNEDEEDGED